MNWETVINVNMLYFYDREVSTDLVDESAITQPGGLWNKELFVQTIAKADSGHLGVDPQGNEAKYVALSYEALAPYPTAQAMFMYIVEKSPKY